MKELKGFPDCNGHIEIIKKMYIWIMRLYIKMPVAIKKKSKDCPGCFARRFLRNATR